MGQELKQPSTHVMAVVHQTYPWPVALQQSRFPFWPDAQVYAACGSSLRR